MPTIRLTKGSSAHSCNYGFFRDGRDYDVTQEAADYLVKKVCIAHIVDKTKDSKKPIVEKKKPIVMEPLKGLEEDDAPQYFSGKASQVASIVAKALEPDPESEEVKEVKTRGVDRYKKANRGFLKGQCDIAITRDGLGLGDTLALTSLFKALKEVNPLARVILRTCSDKLETIRMLMADQPYPDLIVSKKEDIARSGIPYYKFDLTSANYEYEQTYKPDIAKSRASINLDVIGIPGSSKPFYLLDDKDIEWSNNLPIPKSYTFVQAAGKERYKSCDMEQLLIYCRAIVKTQVLGDAIIVLPDNGDEIKMIEESIHVMKCPDIKKSIALMAGAISCLGFDSVFLHASAALDVPFLGMLGPTSSEGRISDHTYGDMIKNNGCDSCFKDSESKCKRTKDHHKSACLYDMDTQEMVEKLQKLKNKKASVLASLRDYLPGEYYTKDFDPKLHGFDVDNSDITKIHQPVHDDKSYVDKWQKKRVDWICDHAVTSKGVLDIGCANGYIVSRMKKPHSRYSHCGVDIDGDRIRLAQREREGIDFYVIDVRFGIPFPDNSFSTVVLAEMLEHMSLDSAKKLLKESVRVSRNKVLITMPFAGGDYMNDPERIIMVESVDHKWKPTEKNIENLLEGYKNKKELDYFSFIEVFK